TTSSTSTRRSPPTHCRCASTSTRGLPWRPSTPSDGGARLCFCWGCCSYRSQREFCPIASSGERGNRGGEKDRDLRPQRLVRRQAGPARHHHGRAASCGHGAHRPLRVWEV